MGKTKSPRGTIGFYPRRFVNNIQNPFIYWEKLGEGEPKIALSDEFTFVKIKNASYGELSTGENAPFFAASEGAGKKFNFFYFAH